LARVLAVAPDLFFASKIKETLTAAGHDVTIVSTPPQSIDADLVIVDLDQVEPSAGQEGGVPRLGFYSHVDVDTRRRAEESGFDRVVPRSRMARELPQLVSQLIGG
jgi:hypothetical protein